MSLPADSTALFDKSERKCWRSHYATRELIHRLPVQKAAGNYSIVSPSLSDPMCSTVAKLVEMVSLPLSKHIIGQLYRE